MLRNEGIVMNTTDLNIMRYLQFQRTHPVLFQNDFSGKGIDILQEYSEIKVLKDNLNKGSDDNILKLGVVYEDQYITIIKDAVRFPTGEIGTYIRCLNNIHNYKKGVVIFPMFEDNIILIKHFRHATRQWHLEIPRGYGEINQTDEQNAHRELFEETGCVATRMLSLGSMFADTGLYGNETLLFFATVEKVGQNYDEKEGINEIMKLSITDFKNFVRENKITDNYTLAAFAKLVSVGILN